ncbi:hypothetical protein GGX14DRAFT_131581 [Mycena pura]|uniref:DNA endonuclease activator Ctp1 C-terminal domain-containing protein n=1 Tax=Mycena pura TaxID=153505 RepID=A0AAD6YQD0_9AGAR|nr:hypothetical protein GGX14DRAFT_131581 [Mycena pura]
MNDTRSTSHGRENRRGPASTPAHTDASKQRTDYSVYKGRGRYGKTLAENDTINSSYAIDPARNGGVHFQYEEVVRGREDRTRLEGGDCECCREVSVCNSLAFDTMLKLPQYYTAIGPLPARLQPPLWRSPPSSPKRKPCRYTHPESGPRRNDATDGVAIAAHKQAISRHRHNWAQGSTPPSFWDISFPTTQEAESINARAEEIHQQKRRRVQEEAENGGRYYKR